MTMHLLPVYYTTTNTRKRRKKKTTKREEAALREHEKFLAKHGISTEQRANRSSTVKKSNLASRHASSRSSVGSEQRSSKPWVAGSSPAESAKSQTRSSVWSERTAHNGYVTGSNPVGSTNKPTWNPSMAKAKPNVYSGDKIIGIAQMHKSNAVPVSRKDDAVDIARMRRG